MKKYLSLILAIFTVLSILAVCVSCGDVTKPDDTTGAASTSAPAGDSGSDETTAQYVFPDANFNDETFTVYARVASTYSASNIICEEQTGETVDDATFKRNALVEAKYHIKLAMKEASSPSSKMTNDISGGVVDYDIVLDERTDLAPFAKKGNLIDFNELNSDFTNPWWDSNSIRDLGINGKYYLVHNSVSISRLNGIRFFYFNKDIVEDYKLIDPYECLKNDTWTLETFIQMVKGVTTENDEDLGVRGLVLETGSSNGIYMHMLIGCGIQYSKFNGGVLEVTIPDQFEKIDNIFGQLKTVFSDKTHVVTIKDALKLDVDGTAEGKNDYDKARNLFAQGHFLFTHTSIGTSSQFKEMNDYGCMPNPKYDNNQKEYAHKCDPYTLIFAIPNDKSIDLDRLSKIMNYWGYESENHVIPAYYDITIKTKRVKEITASQVIDIVRDTVRYELIDVFKIGSVADSLNTAYDSGSISSAWKSVGPAVKKALADFNKVFG